MATPTFTKTGTKATQAATLPKAVFSAEVNNHELLKLAYNTYLANARTNNAVTKERGKVRGGGKKPWRQKGTGRARVGSIRSPIWRGGGIVFGPTGNENYKLSMSTTAKRRAIAQALTVKVDNVVIVEELVAKDGKTKEMAALLNKLGASRNSLIVVANKSEAVVRATNNLDGTKLVGATYINVFDALNADTIIIEKAALSLIEQWLNGGTK